MALVPEGFQGWKEGRKKKRRREELKVRGIGNSETDIKSQHIFVISYFPSLLWPEKTQTWCDIWCDGCTES